MLLKLTETEIKEAISALTEPERCELHAWLQNWPDDDWDRQMKADAAAGRLDRLVREAESEYYRGSCQPLPRK